MVLAPRPLQGFFKCLELKQRLLVGINHTEVRVNVKLIKIFGYQPFAERVYRAYVGACQEGKLGQKMCI